jgi:hypothetical protein
MTEHERLTELIRRSSHELTSRCVGDCGECADKIADHLLTNKCHSLPCDIGDTVYTNCRMQGWYFREKDKPYKAEVVFIGLNGVDNFMNVDFGDGHMLQFPFSQIGKTVFLSEEEALKVGKSK